MYPSDAVNYLNEGRLVDLSVYINDPEIGIPNFKDNVPAGQYSEITQWGDGIYVFPCTTAGEVLFYNKTMFDKYGLEAPKTWTELAECSKIIHEKEGIPGFGTDSLVDTYQCLIMQVRAAHRRGRQLCHRRDHRQGKAQLVRRPCEVRRLPPCRRDVFFSGPFGSQAVASYIGSSAGVSYVELAVSDAFEIGCVPIPQEGPVRYISSWGNNFACLSTDEDHARGAYMFLKFLTSTGNIVQWAEAFGTVPIYKGSPRGAEFQQFAETNIAVKALTEEADDIGMLASVPGAAAMRTEIDKMVQSVALNVSDADTAYAAFETACRESPSQKVIPPISTGGRPGGRPPGRRPAHSGRAHPPPFQQEGEPVKKSLVFCIDAPVALPASRACAACRTSRRSWRRGALVEKIEPVLPALTYTCHTSILMAAPMPGGTRSCTMKKMTRGGHLDAPWYYMKIGRPRQNAAGHRPARTA